MDDERAIELLQSIDSELSSLKLWMPSVDTAAEENILTEVRRTNELLEKLIEKLSGSSPPPLRVSV
jgi:hypothetical protein